MIRAVIFDMDGLMIDSERLHYQAYQEVLKTCGIDFTLEQYLDFWGSDKDICRRIVEKLKPNLSEQTLLEEKNKLFRDVYIHEVTPQPGLFKLLEFLKSKNYPMAVASSSQMHEIKIVLETIGVINYFKEIVSAESVEHGKPAPDCYLLAAKKIGVEPEHCLVLEDAPKGVKAAKAAGMMCFAVPGMGFALEQFSIADKVFGRGLDEVKKYL